MIAKMELENFKSYAGMQSVGPFHKCFSSIVGPNGSGKSNVIDALLFVFGKRAQQMRLKKVSELIHKSASFPGLDFARVSVSFQLIYDVEDHEDDFDIVPGSEFVITRVAYANNSSKYTVNNKATSFADIAVLLKRYGIDLDNNRFLILQGEVEQIAMMKPKGTTEGGEDGLLEYLEDIIGSNVFVPRINDANKALEVVNEQRAEKVQRLRVAERERDGLLDAKQEAETFLSKESELRGKKNALYQCYAKVAGDNVGDFSERMVASQSKLQKEKDKIATSERQLTALKREFEAAKGQHSAVQSTLGSCTAQYAAFERRDVQLNENLKHVRAQIKKYDAAIEKDSKKEVECGEENQRLVYLISIIVGLTLFTHTLYLLTDHTHTVSHVTISPTHYLMWSFVGCQCRYRNTVTH
jgi:structural maintenance of chromosome 4